MRLSGTDAAASRLAALKEPIEYELFGEVFVWPPEMPLEVFLDRVLDDQWDIWLLRKCVGEDAPDRLAKVRTPDGRSLGPTELQRMIDEVRDQWQVSEGESTSSGGSSETPGEPSPSTLPSEVSTPTTSGGQATAAPAAP